ncbi:MAG: hypothetical protein Q7T54_04280 [Candidatus Levybacteria bacterium]|nr:hypothetical protein [Candidatus Levybacteria bacterium]
MKLLFTLVLVFLFLQPQDIYARKNDKKFPEFYRDVTAIVTITATPTSMPTPTRIPIPTPTPTSTPTPTFTPTPTPIAYDLTGYETDEDLSGNVNKSFTFLDRMVAVILEIMFPQFGFFRFLV